MIKLALFLFFLALLPIFIITMFMPYWTRRTESFGVTIPEGAFHTDQLKGMRKKYILYTTILNILATVSFFIMGMNSMSEKTFSIGFTVFIGLYLILSFIVYLHFHQQMKQLKSNKNWTTEKSQQVFVDMNFRQKKLTYSNAWFLIPMVLTFGVILLTIRFYNQIPNEIPIQYSFQGEVTNWLEKNHRSVLQTPVMMIYMTLLFFFINTIIGKAKQQISPEQPEISIQRNVIFRRRWSAYTIISSILLILLFALMQISIIFPLSNQALLIFSFIVTGGMIIGAIVLSITTGQGGSRVKQAATSNGKIINRDDDKYWKLGQFYFNKDDPALFLEKRFGIGWTINLARPLAWITLIVVIGLAFLIPMLLK